MFTNDEEREYQDYEITLNDCERIVTHGAESLIKIVNHTKKGDPSKDLILLGMSLATLVVVFETMKTEVIDNKITLRDLFCLRVERMEIGEKYDTLVVDKAIKDILNSIRIKKQIQQN